MMIYLLTAIGLTPGGSSTVHIYTQKYIEQHNLKIWLERFVGFETRVVKLIVKGAGRAPSLRVVPRHLLTTEEKARKFLSQGSRRVSVGTMKTE
jgi:hypothetical protein